MAKKAQRVDVEKLMRKRKWTGTDAGRVFVACNVNGLLNNNHSGYKPLVDAQKFRALEATLSTDKDFAIYEIYNRIVESMAGTLLRVRGLYQQFCNGYYRHLMNLTLCKTADSATRSAEDKPVIMTAAQYTRLKKETEDRLDGAEESLYSLLFITLVFFMENPKRRPADIKKALSATEAEPVTNERILRTYNIDTGRGYYTLTDGTRSDEISVEEWQAKTERAEDEEERKTAMAKAYKLFYDGVEGITAAYKEKTGKELNAETAGGVLAELENQLKAVDVNEWEDPYRKRTPAYAERNILRKLLYGDELVTPEWHYYEELPEGLNKYDVLVNCLDRYNGVSANGMTEKQLLEEFKADYPELFLSLVAYLESRIPQAKGLKGQQLYKPFISRGELAELDFINFKNVTSPEDEDIINEYYRQRGAENPNLFTNGIAILENPKAHQVDEHGDYKESGNTSLVYMSLDKLADEENAEPYISDYDYLMNGLIKPAMNYLYAYNELLTILGERYDIPELLRLLTDIEELEGKISAYNNAVYMFYGRVCGNEEEKIRKRDIIKRAFETIDIEELKAKGKSVQEVRKEIFRLNFDAAAYQKLAILEYYAIDIALDRRRGNA